MCLPAQSLRRRLGLFILAGVWLVARADPAASVGILVAELPNLTSVTVSISDRGVRTYTLVGDVGRTFTSVASYDPVSGETKETIHDDRASTIKSTAICSADPWITGRECTGGKVSATGFSPDRLVKLAQLRAPVSAFLMTGPDRDRVETAYNKKLAEISARQRVVSAAAKAPPSSLKIATPTPTPPRKLATVMGVTKTGGLVGVPTPTPVRPPYGAVYTDGKPPVTMKAGQTLAVSVTVQNTSSRAWPANGLFRLSYHWYRGSAVLVHDGNRTFMPIVVAPGATINLIAKVTAPSVGAATLRWDMVEENVAWFSDKLVPMSALHEVNVVP